MIQVSLKLQFRTFQKVFLEIHKNQELKKILYQKCRLQYDRLKNKLRIKGKVWKRFHKEYKKYKILYPKVKA